MAIDRWTLYETLAGGNESFSAERDEAISDAADNVMSGIVDDPAYQTDSTINGVEAPMVAARKSSHECEIKAAPNTDLHIGDIVSCLGELWLVVELYTDKIGVINGKMWVCNDIIRFQNGNSIIYSRPCVIDNGSYAKKSTDPLAYVMTNTYEMYLSIDDETRRLFVDKRLSLGLIYSETGEQIMEVYRISGIDLKSRNFGEGSHLMVVTLQRDVYNAENDDIIELVCDKREIEADTGRTKTIVINGPAQVRIGTTRKYVADGCGQQTEWRIDGSDRIKCSFDGAEAKVTIPFEYELIGESFRLIASAIQDGEMTEGELDVGVIGIG